MLRNLSAELLYHTFCRLFNVQCVRVEPSATDPDGTVVVEIPVDAGEGIRTARDLSMWEQLSFAAFLQRYWADNQVKGL